MLQVDPDQYNTFDHAYAITTHKAQGISIDKVFVHAASSQRWANSRNVFYVNVSRAKYDVQLYTDEAGALRDQVRQYQVKLSSLDFSADQLDGLTERIRESVERGLVSVDRPGGMDVGTAECDLKAGEQFRRKESLEKRVGDFGMGD